jgi:hypothetical protein
MEEAHGASCALSCSERAPFGARGNAAEGHVHLHGAEAREAVDEAPGAVALTISTQDRSRRAVAADERPPDTAGITHSAALPDSIPRQKVALRISRGARA